MIVVNTKAYKEGIGRNAVEIAKVMKKVGEKHKVRMALAVQPSDIHAVSNIIETFCQHIDAIEYGSYTGWILPEAVKEAGAKGTLINHSEHLMKIEDIAKAIERAKEVGLEVIVCASNIAITRAIACLNPDCIAIEPPELIGGDISVTKAKPTVVKKAVDEVKKINDEIKVLCGAGIKNGMDVSKAVELGADGILVASGVVKARNKEEILEEMAMAIAHKKQST